MLSGSGGIVGSNGAPARSRARLITSPCPKAGTDAAAGAASCWAWAGPSHRPVVAQTTPTSTARRLKLCMGSGLGRGRRRLTYRADAIGAIEMRDPR